MATFINKVKKFLRKLFGMSTLKDKYDIAKEKTVGKFFTLFTQAVAFYDTDNRNAFNGNHWLKDAIVGLKMDPDSGSISFSFLPYKIVLEYRVTLTSTTVEAFELIRDPKNYPKLTIRALPDLNFTFSAKPSPNGFNTYIFGNNEYCTGNKASDFIDAYTKKLTITFFPEVN